VNAHARRTTKTIPLPSDYVPKLEDLMDAIREDRQQEIDAGIEYYPMSEKRVQEAAELTLVATKIKVVAEETNVFDMPFADRFKVVEEAPRAAEETSARNPVGVETASADSRTVDKVDNGIRFGAACLERARVASSRAFDLKVTAKQHFMAAKTEWMELPQVEREQEPWAERCARIAPHISLRTVDRLISHEVTAPADVGEDGDAEERLKAACEAEGVAYIPPEERGALRERFKEAAAKRRQEQAKAAVAAREANKASASARNVDGVEIRATPKPTAAELEQARRDKAEAIRVANGGKPSQHRRLGSEKAIFDRVMFMVEKAEDEDQLRMIARHIAKVFRELARLADEAGLTGKE
jgi:hypothetical protein